MNNNIPVFFHCSDEYSKYLSVTMISILHNTSSFINFYIIETGISNFHKKQVELLKERFNNFSIEWIHFEYNDVFKKEYFENLNDNDKNKPWPSIHGFCTPFIPLLKTNINKAIYLDLDTILLDDIAKFYNEEIGDNYLGVVPDIVVPMFGKLIHNINNNISINYGQYFCAGVLLINCKKFREDNIIDQYFQLAKTEKFPVCDQDILNRLCQMKNKSKMLNLKYNVIFQPTREQLEERNIDVDFHIFTKAQQITVIRHFANNKPWNTTTESWTGNAIKNFEDYWFFAKMSPFYDGISKNFISSIIESKNTYCKKICYLFNFIPIIKIKKDQKRKLKKYYLFGVIPLFKIKGV